MARFHLRLLTVLLLAVALMGAMGCSGGGGGSATPAVTTGTLALTISGIPAPLAASVQVTGPAGFSQTVQASQSWGSLSPGAYTVTAAQVGTFLPAIPVQTATVVAGQTASVNVTYAAQPVSVSIAPSNPKVGTGMSVQLSAVVTGSSDQGVTWSVETGEGSVTSAGLYTAPNGPGVAVVRATALADSTKSSTATVTISALGGFHISDVGVLITPGGTWDFRAFDDTTPVTTLTWSVSAGGGTIDATGHFVASATLGQHTVSALNTATGQTATTPVVITSTVAFSLYGLFDATHIYPCDAGYYYWDLSPAGVDRTIAFDVMEGAGLGTFHDMGWFRIYEPGATPGTYHVRATPAADPTKARNLSLVVDPLPSVPAFQPTAGAPAVSRTGHRGLRLADGTVLLVGGWGGNPAEYLGGMETFNPTTGTFSAFPAPLATPRIWPTADSLDANRILVTGGQVAWDSASDTAEVVNVLTGTVTPASNPMRTRRLAHQATLLTTGPHTGKVLVTGGMTEPNYYGTTTATADLFDPATLSFSAAGQNMNQARVYHTATRLNDGRVLLAGGNAFDNWGVAGSAELYDPATGSFTPTTGTLKDPRYQHTAVLLNSGKVLLIGGNTRSEDFNSCEIFDPATGLFTAVASMIENRIRHTASLLPDGRVLVIGGDANYRYHGTAEVYDPVANTWTYYGRMSGARSDHMGVLLQSGKVLVTGELDPQSSPKAEISN